MKKVAFTVLVFIVCTVHGLPAVYAEGEAGGFAWDAVDTSHVIFNDRITISTPEGAVFQSSHYGGAMGADADDEYDINLVFSKDGQNMTVNAYELRSYSTGDVYTDALCFIETVNVAQGFAFADPIVMNDAIVILHPNASDSVSAGLIRGALVVAAGDTLIFVGVHADENAVTYPEACIAVAERIINSIEVGSRALEVGERTVSMDSYTMRVDDGYIIRFSQGPDFSVWYFDKMVAIGETGSSFGIYRGAHASYDDSIKPSKRVRDSILGKAVSWNLYISASEGFNENSYADVLMRTGMGFGFFYLHIFASPTCETDWEAIRGMTRSLIDENPSPPMMAWIMWLFSILVGIVLLGVVVFMLFRFRRRRKALAHGVGIACDSITVYPPPPRYNPSSPYNSAQAEWPLKTVSPADPFRIWRRPACCI